MTKDGTIYKLKLMLRSMPPGNSMDMGRGYDDMISCAICSLSQHLMQQVLLPRFIPGVSSCINPCLCLIVGLWTRINSVDTFMYPYALPILQFPYSFSSLCLSCNLSSSLRSLQLRLFTKSIPVYFTDKTKFYIQSLYLSLDFVQAILNNNLLFQLFFNKFVHLFSFFFR